jgi:hypothetical protein
VQKELARIFKVKDRTPAVLEEVWGEQGVEKE